MAKVQQVGIYIGMCDDKDVHDFLSEFSGVISRVWAVPLQSERNMSTSVIENACRMMGLSVSCIAQKEALVESRRWAEDSGGVMCMTGSLFLVGEVLGGLVDDEADVLRKQK